MCSTNSLLMAFIACLIATEVQCGEYTDAPPATNFELYGRGMCCFFGFAGTADVSLMQYYNPSAIKFADAILPKHKIAFAKHPKPHWTFETIEENEQWNVYGIAYLMSIEEYEAYVKTETTCDGKRIGYAVTEKLEVKLEGKPMTIDCNTNLSAGLAAIKPAKDLLAWYVKIFKAAGFPSDYVNKVAGLPTSD